jgi:anti-anti-sigma factor
MKDHAHRHRPQGGRDGIGSTLDVTRTDTADGVRLTAAGEIDRTSAPILAAQLHNAIDAGDGLIVVDLGDVTFMDSSGIHALVTAHQSAPERLRLGTVHPVVQRVLEIAALLDVFVPTDEYSTPSHL